MRTVILFIFSLADVDPLIERGFQLALEGNHRLDVYFALEKHMPSTLSSVMGHIGFLGDRVQDDVRQAIINNYQARIDAIRDDINIAAKKSGIGSSVTVLDAKTDDDLLGLACFGHAEFFIVNYHQEMNLFAKKLISSTKAPVEFYINGKRAML